MQKIRIDFDNPGLPQHISAVENDSQSRFFQATLYENGKAYTAPEGATYSIMYRGFGPQNQGWYDTINDGAGKRAACAVSGNVVTCEIARQALQVPGHVSIVLCVTTGKGYMLKSWPIECDCKNDRYDSTVEIQSFFYITQVSNADWNRAIQALEELKNIIDPTLSLSGKAADAKTTGDAVGELKEALGDVYTIYQPQFEKGAYALPTDTNRNPGEKVFSENRARSTYIRVKKGAKIISKDDNYLLYAIFYDTNDYLYKDVSVNTDASHKYWLRECVVPYDCFVTVTVKRTDDANIGQYLGVIDKTINFEMYLDLSARNPYITPEQFGAVGNGVINDTLALQTAINFAITHNVSLKSSGKTYAIYDSIVVDCDSQYSSTFVADFGGSIIKLMAQKNAVEINISAQKWNGSIKNLVIDANNYNVYALYCKCVRKMTFDNIYIKNIGLCGIEIAEGSSAHFSNIHLYVKNSLDGEELIKARGITINTSDIHFNDVFGINLYTAIRSKGGNFFERVHCWIWDYKLFDGSVYYMNGVDGKTGTDFLSQCYPDTYNVSYKIRYKTGLVFISQGIVYWNPLILDRIVANDATVPQIYIFKKSDNGKYQNLYLHQLRIIDNKNYRITMSDDNDDFSNASISQCVLIE